MGCPSAQSSAGPKADLRNLDGVMGQAWPVSLISKLLYLELCRPPSTPHFLLEPPSVYMAVSDDLSKVLELGGTGGREAHGDGRPQFWGGWRWADSIQLRQPQFPPLPGLSGA